MRVHWLTTASSERLKLTYLRPGVTVHCGATAHSNSTKGWYCFHDEFWLYETSFGAVASFGFGALSVQSRSKVWRSVSEFSSQTPARSRPACSCLVSLKMSPLTR